MISRVWSSSSGRRSARSRLSPSSQLPPPPRCPSSTPSRAGTSASCSMRTSSAPRTSRRSSTRPVSLPGGTCCSPGTTACPRPPTASTSPAGLADFLATLERRTLAPAELAAVKARLRAMYEAGPGAKVEEEPAAKGRTRKRAPPSAPVSPSRPRRSSRSSRSRSEVPPDHRALAARRAQGRGRRLPAAAQGRARGVRRYHPRAHARVSLARAGRPRGGPGPDPGPGPRRRRRDHPARPLRRRADRRAASSHEARPPVRGRRRGHLPRGPAPVRQARPRRLDPAGLLQGSCPALQEPAHRLARQEPRGCLRGPRALPPALARHPHPPARSAMPATGSPACAPSSSSPAMPRTPRA